MALLRCLRIGGGGSGEDVLGGKGKAEDGEFQAFCLESSLVVSLNNGGKPTREAYRSLYSAWKLRLGNLMKRDSLLKFSRSLRNIY